MRISHQLRAHKENIQGNAEKFKVNKTSPCFVSRTIKLLDIGPQEGPTVKAVGVGERPTEQYGGKLTPTRRICASCSGR